MVDRDYVPARGDIVWLSFTPQARNEQAGHRPAMVLSPEAYNAKTGLALFCPISSRVKGCPFEVQLPIAAAVSGVVLSDRIKSLDWKARNAQFECRAPGQVVSEVLSKVNVLLE